MSVSQPPSPLNASDSNYLVAPFVVNFPAMTGDIAQSIASLRSLRLSLIQLGPRPNFVLHGQDFKFKDLMEYIDVSIMSLAKELTQSTYNQNEFISAVR